VTVVPSQPANPQKSPTYPQRVHVRERAQWQAVLKTWEDRIAEARRSLDSRGADHPAHDRLYAQMLGARDQIADAARRLPMEVGELYEEDKHRLEEAVAALERLFERWQTPGA
jgi:hypothetical protein